MTLFFFYFHLKTLSHSLSLSLSLPHDAALIFGSLLFSHSSNVHFVGNCFSNYIFFFFSKQFRGLCFSRLFAAHKIFIVNVVVSLVYALFSHCTGPSAIYSCDHFYFGSHEPTFRTHSGMRFIFFVWKCCWSFSLARSHGWCEGEKPKQQLYGSHNTIRHLNNNKNERKTSTDYTKEKVFRFRRHWWWRWWCSITILFYFIFLSCGNVIQLMMGKLNSFFSNTRSFWFTRLVTKSE